MTVCLCYVYSVLERFEQGAVVVMALIEMVAQHHAVVYGGVMASRLKQNLAVTPSDDLSL